MKRMTCICLVVLMFCTGCASTNWVKQDNPARQVQVDTLACEKEADSMVTGAWIWIIPYAGIFMGIVNSVKRHNYYDRCMESKGYEKR